MQSTMLKAVVGMQALLLVSLVGAYLHLSSQISKAVSRAGGAEDAAEAASNRIWEITQGRETVKCSPR